MLTEVRCDLLVEQVVVKLVVFGQVILILGTTVADVFNEELAFVVIFVF